MEGNTLDTSFGAPNPLAEMWGVYTLAGIPVFNVDSCVEIKYDHDAKVSSFPVELGAFTSYNKVLEPFECKIKLSVSGAAAMTAFMTQLEAEVSAPNLYNVFTPEFTYLSMTLKKLSYPRDLKGRSIIHADLDLIQVKQVSPSYATIKAAKHGKSNDKVVTGRIPPLSTLDYALQTPQERINGNGYSYPMNQSTLANAQGNTLGG